MPAASTSRSCHSLPSHEPCLLLSSLQTARRNNFSLLQECLLPRLLFSPEDALFCAKFFEMLHELDTPNFATLMVYNEVGVCVGV